MKASSGKLHPSFPPLPHGELLDAGSPVAARPAARAIAQQRGSPARLPTASFFGLDCGSGITRERLERYRSDPAIEVVGDLSWFYEAACPAWETDLGDDFRAGSRTSIPTVVVHGTWDVSTRLDSALELVPCFENPHFIPVEGETDGLPGSIELPPIQWGSSW